VQRAPALAERSPLAAIWVWLAFDEAPSSATIIGAASVFGAVLGFATDAFGKALRPS